MSQLKLSICIPTYNFGRFIADTLHSILDQKGADEIEVVVADGNSTDNTAEIVMELRAHYPQIKYFRLPVKGGFDRDTAKSVELSSGQYCWLFSSDDIMKNGAVQNMLREIEEGHDLYLCKHMECKADMTRGFEYPVMSLTAPTVFELGKPDVRKTYFSHAINTEAFYSFMGGVVIKRAKWDLRPINEDFVGCCWAHVARIFEIMPTGLTVKYLAAPYLDRRGENDSFSDRGLVNRFKIGIDGYHRLADTFFGHESREAFHIRRVVRNEYGFKAFFLAKLRCKERPETESKKALDELLNKAYCDPSLTSTLMRFAYNFCPVPGWLYRTLRQIYRALRCREWALSQR